MVRYATESEAQTFVIGTEEGLLHRLQKDNPQKTFHLLTQGLVCPNMKKTTLESVVKTMEQRRNAVTVPEEVRVKAKLALDRMLAVA
jgi:quinolinate synthase